MNATLKAEVAKDFRLHDSDTGSADVQVALLTRRINELTQHLQAHKKDFSSRRGLFKMVNQRRKLLQYLNATAPSRYDTLLKKLNLRK
jgi:small subunit ribosomal protein S15